MKSIKRVSGDIKRSFDRGTKIEKITICYKAIMFFLVIVPSLMLSSIVIGIAMFVNPLDVFEEIISGLF